MKQENEKRRGRGRPPKKSLSQAARGEFVSELYRDSCKFCEAFARGVRIARKQKGMSQKEFADLIGTGANSLRRIERALGFVNLTTAYIVSRALDQSVEELVRLGEAFICQP